MQFDVTNLNYVSQADNVPLIPTVVLFVAFSENGDWMSTVSTSLYGSFLFWMICLHIVAAADNRVLLEYILYNIYNVLTYVNVVLLYIFV